jgi:predicted nucleic acid-binding protein
MIVVDTNVITYLLIAGDFTDLAEQAFRKDGEWHAPLLWKSELEMSSPAIWHSSR